MEPPLLRPAPGREPMPRIPLREREGCYFGLSIKYLAAGHGARVPGHRCTFEGR